MIKPWIKRIWYRIKYYKKGVKIGSGVQLDLKNIFEGLNVIGNNTEVAGSRIGLGTYISNHSVIRKAIIGRFCSIGSNVQTGLGQHPAKDFVSTHPAFFSTQKQAGFSFSENDIFEEHIYLDAEKKHVVDIGNDVWIGNNVLIMDGLKIGDGAIIAAGSVVTKNVAPYAIVAGLPARLIRFRFTEPQIEKMLDIRWWNWDLEKVRSKHHLFNNIDLFISSVNPM